MSLDWKGKFLGAAIIDIYWFLTAAPRDCNLSFMREQMTGRQAMLLFTVACLDLGSAGKRFVQSVTGTHQ